jgi:hypothetical protein
MLIPIISDTDFDNARNVFSVIVEDNRMAFIEVTGGLSAYIKFQVLMRGSQYALSGTGSVKLFSIEKAFILTREEETDSHTSGPIFFCANGPLISSKYESDFCVSFTVISWRISGTSMFLLHSS